MIKKKKNSILKIFGVFFLLFMALYIANLSGYYESKIRDRVVITEEGIKEFEEKVSNGEEINMSSFLELDKKDYSSKMSNFGENITSGIQKIVEGSYDLFSDILKSLF